MSSGNKQYSFSTLGESGYCSMEINEHEQDALESKNYESSKR